jgi:hypothetical protein
MMATVWNVKETADIGGPFVQSTDRSWNLKGTADIGGHFFNVHRDSTTTMFMCMLAQP